MMVHGKKASKNVTTTVQLLVAIIVNEKVRNSQKISGSLKIATL